MNPPLNIYQALSLFVKRYYKNQIIKGLGLLLLIVLPLFLLFTSVVYLQYLSSALRGFLYYSLIAVAGLTLIKYVAIPAFKLFGIAKNRLSQTEAALIIGNYFPEIQDRLLNTLQLLEEQKNKPDNDLLVASIHQKMDAIKPFDFSLAINKKETIKYGKYASLALLMFLTISVFNGNIIKEGSEMLFNYNKNYVRKAPFLFNFITPDVIKKGDKYTLKMNLVGETIPEDAFVFLDQQWVKMRSTEKGFDHVLSNLQNTKSIQFKAGDFYSETFELKVVAPPSLNKVKIELKYPAYIGKPNETKSNTSDLLVPEGTQITWNLAATNTDKLQLLLNNKPLQGTNYFNARVLKSSTYAILLNNKVLKQTDTLAYGIQVVKDQFPSINAEKKEDSLSAKVLYFLGSANDDYGISRLTFHYNITQEDGNKTISKSVAVNMGKSNSEVFSFVFDLANREFNLGSKLAYYFEVFDNDGVNGAKSTKTPVAIYLAPSAEQLEQQVEQSVNNMVAQMDNAINDAIEIQKLIKELQVKMQDNKEMTWQEKNKISNLLEKQKKLQENVAQIAQEQNKIRTREKEFKPNQKEQEKQKILDEMFKKTMSPEMKELFKKLEDLLKKENKSQMKQELDKMNQADKDLSKELERLQEQLKQLELEKKIEETAEKLDKLAEKQEKLAAETKEDKKPKEELAKEQNELKKEFDNIKKDLDKIEENNNDLKDKLKLAPSEKEEKEIDESMESSEESLSKGKNKKAEESQKDAAEKMKDLAKKMKEKLEMEMAEREAEDYKTIRQLLENLIVLSHAQEKNMDAFKAQPNYSPKYIALAKEQQKIKRDAEMIEDSLLALSKRNIKIRSFVNTEIGKINHHMEKSIGWLSERNTYMAVADQQYVMTSVNNLAVMLSESLKNMQMEMNAKKKDGPKKMGQCKNPGSGKGEGEGKNNPNGKKPSMGALKQLQGDLNQMGEERKDGKKNGGGENGALTSEDFVRMANQQEALRNALEQLEQQLKEEGQAGALGDINKTKQLMEQTEKELVNKVYDAKTIQRQKEIAIRLMQHEQAEIKQEQDEKRQAESAKPKERTLPPGLAPYLEELKRQQEILKTVPPELMPYYNEKVKTYFIAL